VWLVQKGSPESKKLDEVGRESDEDQHVGRYAQENSPAWAKANGWRRTVFSNSLGLVMGAVFVLAWLTRSIAGVAAYNEQQLSELQDPVSWAQYLTEADFWNRTLQNWQSELLAVASMAILSIYLRQRGSPESKPVGTPTQHRHRRLTPGVAGHNRRSSKRRGPPDTTRQRSAGGQHFLAEAGKGSGQ
jgi:hypothetical protein